MNVWRNAAARTGRHTRGSAHHAHNHPSGERLEPAPDVVPSPKSLPEARERSTMRSREQLGNNYAQTPGKTREQGRPVSRTNQQDRRPGPVCKTSIPGSNPGGASNLRSRLPTKARATVGKPREGEPAAVNRVAPARSSRARSDRSAATNECGGTDATSRVLSPPPVAARRALEVGQDQRLPLCLDKGPKLHERFRPACAHVGRLACGPGGWAEKRVFRTR